MLRLVASVLAAFVGFSVGHSIPKWIENRSEKNKQKQNQEVSANFSPDFIQDPSPYTSSSPHRPIRKLSMRRNSVRRFKLSVKKHHLIDVKNSRKNDRNNDVANGRSNAQNDIFSGLSDIQSVCGDAQNDGNEVSKIPSTSLKSSATSRSYSDIENSASESGVRSGIHEISSESIEAKASRLRQWKAKLLALKCRALANDHRMLSSSNQKLETECLSPPPKWKITNNANPLLRNAKSDSQRIRHALSSSSLRFLTLETKSERER